MERDISKKIDANKLAKAIVKIVAQKKELHKHISEGLTLKELNERGFKIAKPL